MSRSVTSRRSLGSQSNRSARTTLPRISSGASFTSRLTEKRSQLSLIQRSVPSTTSGKLISTQEKAIRILENLGKRIPKLNLKPDQQFNFCLALKQLHEQIDDPKQSGFWADWDSLKQSIISAVKEQSIQLPNVDSLVDFCSSSLDQFSIGLGKVREKLPAPNDTSRKSDSIQQKFIELSESFSMLQRKFESLSQISDDSAKMRSLVTKLGAFRQVLPTEYQIVFMAMRDTEVKKGNGVVTRNPLLSPNQRNQIIRSLTTQIEAIEHRIMEFLDPKLAVTTATDNLQTVEMNLRKVITDFPEEKRKEKSKEQMILEEKQQRFSALESKLADLKAQTSELSGELAMLNSSESFLKEKINEEKRSWKFEKKELLATLNSPIDQNAIQRSAETLEKLRKQNFQLQNDITSRRSDQDIEDLRRDNHQIKQKYASFQQKVSQSDEELLRLRAQNDVLIELLDDDYVDYKTSTPLFIAKREAQISLDNEADKDFQLRIMNEKRYLIQTVNEKAPSMKEFSAQISANQVLFDQIESQLQQLAKLQVRLFRRKFKNHILNCTNTEYEKICKQFEGIDSNDEDDSELGNLKSEAELLKDEFKLSVLRNSRGSSTSFAENQQIQEQKALNQRIIKNGNLIRQYLLRVQSTNSAINVAIKSGKSIDVIEDERMKKDDSARKYAEVRKEQEKATAELEEMLGIEHPEDAVVETRFAIISEEIRRLEDCVEGEGDLTELIARLKRKNKNLEGRSKTQPPPMSSSYSDQSD